MERKIVSTEDLSHGYHRPKKEAKPLSPKEIERLVAEEDPSLIIPELTEKDRVELEKVRKTIAKMSKQQKKEA